MRRDQGIVIDWEEVHAIRQGLHDNPHHILGPHLETEGVTINAYVKDALKVEILHRDSNVAYEMRASGIDDFFTLATDEKKIFPYRVKATYRDGSTYEYIDAYAFEPVIDNMELAAFSQGIDYEAYKVLGAHKKRIDGVDGVLFAVWAPDAVRVSVVGTFNMWDGTRHPMRRLSDTGVFELFVPQVPENSLYKYEIRTPEGEILLKSDPYAVLNQTGEEHASVVSGLKYRFKDGKWMRQREKKRFLESPMHTYIVDLAQWKKDGEEISFRSLAPELCDYVVGMGYTHIELLPVMDTVDGTAQDTVLGYYAVNGRFGTPEDFMYFVDYMHQHEIGVIMDWCPCHYSQTDTGLYHFDGSALYEDANWLRAASPLNTDIYFNYGRSEVSNYLIANAMYWVELYHIDGLNMLEVARMLYLDYDREPDQWMPNIYGGNENLDAVEFMKHLNSMMKKRNPGVLMLAQDSSLWPDVTKVPEEEGLGFDYKWNMGWEDDLTQYITTAPQLRQPLHTKLTFSLIYAYNEQFQYGFSYPAVGKTSVFEQIPGTESEKQANMRVLYGYLMTQPGKKYTAMCEMWADQKMQEYIKEWNALYQNSPALWKMDYENAGFEWINSLTEQEGILVYARMTKNPDDTMVIVCNFSDQVKKNYGIGVPFAGKYKEILNSDDVRFGGEGNNNPRMKQSKSVECDARPNSITITIPAYGCQVFQYNVKGGAKPATHKETAGKATASKKKGAEVKKETPAKKTQTQVKVTEEKKAETKVKEMPAKKTQEQAKVTEEKKAETKVKETSVKKTQEQAKVTEEKKAETKVKETPAKKTQEQEKVMVSRKIETEATEKAVERNKDSAVNTKKK